MAGKNQFAALSIVPASIAATTNGTGIDMTGFTEAYALISIGAQGQSWTSSNYNTFTIEGSNTSASAGFTALSTAMMISPSTNSLILDSTDDASDCYEMHFRVTDYRWYRVVCTETGTISTGTPITAHIVRGKPRYSPTDALTAGQ